MELLEFVLGGFWRFIGFIIILYTTLYFGVNGIINLVRTIIKSN